MTATVYVSQVAREVLYSGASPPLVVSQLVREVLRTPGAGNPKVHVDQVFREVLYATTRVPSKGQAFMCAGLI